MATVSLQAVYDQARRLLEGGDTERAIAVAQHILDHFPHNLEAQRILGEAFLASRRPEQAQASFQTVLHADPENIPAYVGLGISHERQGRIDQAIAAFEHALEIKPDMPELRSQLLRLYTDTWGSESAQLRLSRAGLARLYAKGHMLPQAVQEFRSVIAEQPDRYDARVGLAEVLWRNGQDDTAVTVCEDILAERPNTLKANLLLGYLLLSMGDERGQQYWDAAAAIDPYHSVARALFEQLPESAADPTLPAWDEQRWLTDRADQERVSREQEEAQQPVEPVAAVAAAPAAASLDDELFGASWMSAIDAPSAPAAPAEPVAASPADDDFLASLLSFDDEPGAQSDDPRATAKLAPFSLDDVEPASAATPAPQTQASEPEETAEPASSVDESAADPALSPFSLSDLGLSDDEIAGLDSLGGAPAEPQAEAPAAPAPQAEAAEPPPAASSVDENAADPALSPFSLSDLGLSDDEIASLDSLGGAPAAPQAETPAPASSVDEPATDPALTPFSLSDLGLSDDEIAGLDSLGGQAAAPVDEPATDPALTPFSLSDLGLSDDEIASLDTIGAQPAPADREAPRAAPSASADAQAEADDELPDELMPFSLDDLDINAGGAASFDLGSLPSSLQPFSLEDMGETPPAPSQAQPAPLSVPEDEEPSGEPAAYSWQQPSSKPSTDFLRDSAKPEQPTGHSIFAKLRQRHSELPPVEPPPLAPVADDETDMSLFSHDDVSLRDDADVGQPAAPASAPADETPAEPTMTPFSLSDLGLSPDEIASLGLGDATTAPAEEPPPAAATSPASAQAEAPAPAASVDEPATEPTLSPFSLSDLGLSDDEIASLGLDQQEAQATGAEAAAQSSDAPADPDLVPFSLDDLGLNDPSSFNADAMSTELRLTDDELAGMDLGSFGATPSGSDESSTVDTGDPALDRLITLGQRQGFVDLTDIIAAVQNPEEESERIEEIGLVLHRAGIEIRDGDEVIDMDEEVEDVDAIAPFDDASDEIYGEAEPAAPAQPVDAPVSDEPDMTPFSLSDLGLSPEEIAALGLSEGDTGTAGPAPVVAEETPAQSVDAPVSEEPDMTPFSLSDLGLSPEEIAALGLSEGDTGTTVQEPVAAELPFAAEEAPVADETPAPAEAPAPSVDAPVGDEPDMTPFSLSDLGLSPEEIAALGLAEGDVGTAGPEPVVAEEVPVADETPAHTEMPAPSVEAPAQPVDTSPSDEPDMTPFSLSDLGLTAEEIAALGLAEGDTGVSPLEPTAEQAATQPEPQEEAVAPTAEAPTATADVSAPSVEAPAQPVDPSPSDEPDMMPFSLSDLGLSPEEIAAFEQEQASGASQARSGETPASDDLDASPFSLDGLGLTAEEIDALDLPSVEPAAEQPAATEAAEEADEFDFMAAEAKLGQSGPVRAQPGQPRPPREEEPPPPASPEDLAFTPESLDALDTIWPPLPAAEAAPTPPPAAKAPEQPAQRPSTIERLPARGEASRPSREASARSAERPARSPEPQRREPAPAPAPVNRAGPAWKPRQQQSFVPTGDEQLDAFLNQLDTEPDNDHLRLAIARASGKSGRLDLALFQYKALIRAGSDLDDVVGDIQDLIDEHEEARDLQRLYRVLGDAYSKQNRFRDAVEAYSWTFGK